RATEAIRRATAALLVGAAPAARQARGPSERATAEKAPAWRASPRLASAIPNRARATGCPTWRPGSASPRKAWGVPNRRVARDAVVTPPLAALPRIGPDEVLPSARGPPAGRHSGPKAARRTPSPAPDRS